MIESYQCLTQCSTIPIISQSKQERIIPLESRRRVRQLASLPFLLGPITLPQIEKLCELNVEPAIIKSEDAKDNSTTRITPHVLIRSR